MQRTVLFLIITLLPLVTFSQGFLKKLQQTVEETLDPSSSDVEASDNRMKAARDKQLVRDTSNYNYIFSQGNRASFFANRDSKESIFLTLAKNYEDENIVIIRMRVVFPAPFGPSNPNMLCSGIERLTSFNAW